MRPTEKPPVTSFGGRRVAFGVGILALCTLCLVAVLAIPGWNPFQTSTPYAALVAAVATSRPVEGRLTGGFKYGPLRSPTRSGRASASTHIDVRVALEQIRAAALRDESSGNKHELGVAQMVVGELDAAVVNLDAAATERPREARFQSDLAACYLARAKALDRPDDYPRALAAAKRALKADPNLVEARFNLALALESLSLVSQATQEWGRYLDIDPSSPWGTEARQHPKMLAEHARVPWARLKPTFVAAVAARDAVALREWTRSHLDPVRDYFDDELLPAWAAARLRGDDAEATAVSRQCGALAAALERASGDRMPGDACGQVAKLSALPGARGAEALALGLVELGRARSLYEQDKVAEAARVFATARHSLESVDSDQAAWCTLHEAIAGYYAGTFDAVRQQLTTLAAQARRRTYRRLEGRAHWMLGLVALQRADYSTVLGEYRSALDIFTASGAQVNAVAMRALLAEVMMHLADDREAWRHRFDALQQMDGALPPRRVHTLLISGAADSLREGLPESAVAFAAGALESARAASAPAFELEARLYLARGLNAQGDSTAPEQLQAARAVLDGLDPGPLKSRFEAEFALSSAYVGQDTPAVGDRLFGDALALFERQGSYLRTSQLHGDRAALRLRSGDRAGAERDLLAAIERFVRARETLPRDQLLRLSYFEHGWPVFVQLADLRAREHRYDEAIAIATEGRMLSVPTIDRVAARTPLAIGGLPSGVVLVSYVVLPDRVLMSASRDAAPTTVERAIGRDSLRTLVRRFRTALQQNDPHWPEQANELYRLLIEPLAASLSGARALWIMPDDALASLPFVALSDPKDGQNLLDRYEIAFASAAPGRHAVRQPLAHAALVIETGREGVSAQLPVLPSARAEAMDVAASFPGAVSLYGPAATREAVLAAVGRGARVIHFAGHAVANADRPLTSRLILAGAEPLFAYELAEQHLAGTDLVVLSACTSLGGPVSGAGLVGLSSALIGAGADAVVGTLWDVEDDASAAFSRAFYQRYASGTRAPTTAFRAALREMRADRRTRRPGDWALWTMVTSLSIGG